MLIIKKKKVNPLYVRCKHFKLITNCFNPTNNFHQMCLLGGAKANKVSLLAGPTKEAKQHFAAFRNGDEYASPCGTAWLNVARCFLKKA